MVAGAPFFSGEGEADGVGVGVPLASGVTLGLGEGEADSVGDGDGEGDVLRFLLLEEGLGEASGEGLGDAFFFLGEGETTGPAFCVGVGLGVVFFFGDGALSGDAVGFGEGDFVAVAFFFVLRGAGVGVGAKIFFSLVPNDSSAAARSAPAASIPQRMSAPQTILICRIGART